MVSAADRFRTAVTGRPWQRRRRTIMLVLLLTVLLVAGAVAAGLFLPQLQVHSAKVEGITYVDRGKAQSVLEAELEDPMVLVNPSKLERKLEQIPGVRSAEVSRRWPDTLTARITEREAVARVTRPDARTFVLDAEGVQLPEAAAGDRALMPLVVGAGSQDPAAATEGMLAVWKSVPEPLHSSIREMSATSRNDVTLSIALEGKPPKKVVWGDDADPALKAKVVSTLLQQPGSVIDVSSPVAPVTR